MAFRRPPQSFSGYSAVSQQFQQPHLNTSPSAMQRLRPTAISFQPGNITHPIVLSQHQSQLVNLSSLNAGTENLNLEGMDYQRQLHGSNPYTYAGSSCDDSSYSKYDPEASQGYHAVYSSSKYTPPGYEGLNHQFESYRYPEISHGILQSTGRVCLRVQDATKPEKTLDRKKHMSRQARVLSLKQELERAAEMTEKQLKEDLEKVEKRRNALYEAIAKQDEQKARGGKFTKFWLFSKLPMELRLKIWKHAIPGARNVVIEPYRFNLKSQRPSNYELRFRCFVTPPAMLSACKISREVLLSTYTTCIEGGDTERKIRFDGRNDTMILLNYPLLVTLSGHKVDSKLIDCLTHIKRIAIKWDPYLNNHVEFQAHVSWLQVQFPHLEKLNLVGNPKDLPNAVMRAQNVLGLENMDSELICYLWLESVNQSIEQAYAKKKAIESQSAGDTKVEEKLQVDLMSFFDTRKEGNKK